MRVALLTLGCLACTRPLKLPTAPAPAGESPVRGVLELLLGDSPSIPTVVLDTTVPVPPLDPGEFIKDFWVDSAIVGFRAAFADLNHRRSGPFRLDSTLVRGLPLRLVSKRPPQESFRGPTEGLWFVTLSRIGFNTDSTFAVVYSDYYCGSLCAGAAVFLFARRPGLRWGRWHTQGLWVS